MGHEGTLRRTIALHGGSHLGGDALELFLQLIPRLSDAGMVNEMVRHSFVIR